MNLLTTFYDCTPEKGAQPLTRNLISNKAGALTKYISLLIKIHCLTHFLCVDLVKFTKTSNQPITYRQFSKNTSFYC